jgi:hypothetical protein
LFLSLVLSFASLPAADPATWEEKHQDLLGARRHVELCVRLLLLFVFAGDLYQYLAHG